MRRETNLSPIDTAFAREHYGGSCWLSITRCLRLLGMQFEHYSMTVIDFIVLLPSKMANQLRYNL